MTDATETIDHILFHATKKDCFIRERINDTAEEAEELVLREIS